MTEPFRIIEPFGQRFKNMSADEKQQVYDYCKARDFQVGDFCTYGNSVVVLHTVFPYVCDGNVIRSMDPRLLKFFQPAPNESRLFINRLYDIRSNNTKNGKEWYNSTVYN
jgi:hypothetical protein